MCLFFNIMKVGEKKVVFKFYQGMLLINTEARV